MIFWHKIKIDNSDPNNVSLPIATNIPMLLMTGFVLKGHIFYFICCLIYIILSFVLCALCLVLFCSVLLFRFLFCLVFLRMI